MRAMRLTHTAPIETRPLELVDLPKPVPGQGEILVQVKTCGVCRTDLHVIEGDLAHVPSGIVPGHQVVGEVVELGRDCRRFPIGARVGAAWLRSTCGECEHCRTGRENLCDRSRYTGYHENGGYAEYVTVPELFAHPLPSRAGDDEAVLAPLLCGGIIGYRALRRAALPRNGTLAIFGFGSSAHMTMQVALSEGARVFVYSRGEKSRALARRLGAQWAGEIDDVAPELAASAIVFAPAGEVVPRALQRVSKGGRVVIAGISLSTIPPLDYESCLFHEKELVSVEANTRRDAEEFLATAERINLTPNVSAYPLESANEVLLALKAGRIEGSAVLRVRT